MFFLFYNRYIRDFKNSKEDLTMRLFKLFNETVFENKVCSVIYAGCAYLWPF